MRLAFAGTPDFAVPALDALLRHGFDVCAVFTQPDRPAGRGRARRESPVKQRALALGLPVHQPESFRATAVEAQLAALRLDALVVVAFGQILPAGVLAVPRLGCINIHASLLPRWRGAAPIQRALLAGDAHTGISIMRMDAGLDTGPVLAARALAIDPKDTGGSLHDRLAALGAVLICETLARLQSGAVTATPQPADGVTYAAKIDKSECAIDWRQDAAAIERRVRAFNPWPVAETRLDGAQLRIWEAHCVAAAPSPVAPGTILAAGDDGIDVACGRGALRLTRVQLAGRRPVSAGEFRNARPRLTDAVLEGA